MAPLVGTGVVAVLALVAAVSSYAFAWYAWRDTEHPVSDRFAALMVADGSWALFAFLELVGPTDALSLLWSNFVELSAALAAAYWFLFVVDYTGSGGLVPDWLGRLVVGEAVLYGLVYTLNPGQLVYTDPGVAQFGALRLPYATFGPLQYAQVAVVYTLLVTSFVLLGRFFVRSRNLYRKQAGVIFAVTLLVVLANAAFLSGLSPNPRLDLTPVFFVVQAVGVGVALYRYDFLDVEPLAAHTLLEELDDPVFVIDTGGRLVDWNGAAAEYVDDDAPVSVDDIEIPELSAALTPSDGGPTVGTDQVSTTLTRADGGELVTFDVRTTPIPDHYDVVRAQAVVLRDITDREEQRRALETQNERLEEFTGVVSHDLRSPLQVIDGRIQLARETGDISQLDEAADAVDRMETLLDDLLELAREGQVLDERREVNVADCCSHAWRSIDSAEATLLVETDAAVVADETRLQQVFENLFANAVEHGSTSPDSQDAAEHGATSTRTASDDAVEHGDAGVTITVGDTDDGFYVADDGPGIPPDRRGRVFDLGETTSDDGTGFGLAIVERIVEAHGWSITATESEDGGARFEVSLADREPPAVDK